MFELEPMVGKMLLRMVGGMPSGWVVALAFFQFALLLGYGLACVLGRLPMWLHLLAVGLLLLAGLVMLPPFIPETIIDHDGWPESVSIFLALAYSLTIPFVALAALSPTLQRLFGAGQPKGHSPYFLFAASNLGSLVGLLAYPLWIERVIGLSQQAFMWRSAYIALVIMVCLCCALLPRVAASALRAHFAPVLQDITWRQRILWMLLAFVPSSLMIGVTSYVTLDSSLFPLVAIMPLALYLLTFIIAFARRSSLLPVWLLYAHPLSIALLVFLLVVQPFEVGVGYGYAFIPILPFFLTALLCHFQLAKTRPTTDQLTAYYFWIACGGAMGGVFNIFVAPLVFALPLEFVLVALASCFMHPGLDLRRHPSKKFIACLLILAAVSIIILRLFVHKGHTGCVLFSSLAVCGSLICISRSPRGLAAAALVLLAIVFGMRDDARPVTVERNFFGIARVFDYSDARSTTRVLYNGSQVHSLEIIRPNYERAPAGFFSPNGALSDIMNLPSMNEIGIIGLGAGGILCYTAPNREFTAYEINPVVVKIAREQFDYIRNCGEPTMRVGDARRLLDEDKEKKYDILAFDVFSSDSLPVHLLTKEAFQIYLNRLTPEGVIAFHSYSHYYDLNQPFGHLAQVFDLHVLAKAYVPATPKEQVLWGNVRWRPLPWTVFTRSEAVVTNLKAHGWQDLPRPNDAPVWTDDFTDSFSAIKYP